MEKLTDKERAESNAKCLKIMEDNLKITHYYVKVKEKDLFDRATGRELFISDRLTDTTTHQFMAAIFLTEKEVSDFISKFKNKERFRRVKINKDRHNEEITKRIIEIDSTRLKLSNKLIP